MKAQILTIEGKKGKEIELPNCFNEEIREDLIKRTFLASIVRQPYGNFPLAGKLVSASGKIRHARRKYKTACGYGISRVPRKILTRKGERFYWQGAFIPGTRGGREAHPPKVEKIWTKKINNKEKEKAIASAIAATASTKAIEKRYEKAKELGIEKIKFPIIIESKLFETKKIKEIKELLKKILGPLSQIAFPKKQIRAGKGKIRGRYKKNKGLLIITTKEDLKVKSLGVDVISVKKLDMKQLAPAGIPGRLTIYTEDAIKELSK